MVTIIGGIYQTFPATGEELASTDPPQPPRQAAPATPPGGECSALTGDYHKFGGT